MWKRQRKWNKSEEIKNMRKNNWYIEVKGHLIYNSWHSFPMKRIMKQKNFYTEFNKTFLKSAYWKCTLCILKLTPNGQLWDVPWQNFLLKNLWWSWPKKSPIKEWKSGLHQKDHFWHQHTTPENSETTRKTLKERKSESEF